MDALCKGLEDASTAVRAASAAALGKLKLGGGKCLERRLGEESNAAVNSPTIKKAIAQVGAGDEPALTSKTRFYVAIGKTSDKTGLQRRRSRQDGPRRDRRERDQQAWTGYVVAPDDETSAQATKRLAKFKQLKAFYLSPKIWAPAYAGNKLTIKVRRRDLHLSGQGTEGHVHSRQEEHPRRLLFRGSKRPKTSSSRSVAEGALETFSKNAERIE